MVKRPIVIACLGYITGIIFGLYFKIGIALFFILALIATAIVKYLKLKRYIKVIFPKKAIIIFLIFIIIGITYITLLNKKYNRIYEIKNPIEISGIIENVENKEYSNKYIVKVKQIENKNYINTKLILYTKKEQLDLEYGDYINLIAEYSKPEDSRNYNGFSYANYLKQNNIYGTISPINEVNVIQKEKVNLILKTVNNIRNSIKNDINTNLSEDASAIFLGIFLGDKSQISDEINTYFKESNMAHILAVSGAHVAYITLTLNLIIGKTNKKFYLACSIFTLVFFMFLTNFSASVTRACIMSIIICISKLIYRKSDIYNNLGISGLVILLRNPYEILNIGFQLTYIGTLGIVLLNKRINEIVNKKISNNEYEKNKLDYKMTVLSKLKVFAKNSVVISISVQILIVPIIIMNFNTVSYNFLISGILSTPIFSMIMIVGIFSILLVPFRKIIFFVIEILISILISISKLFSTLPFSSIIIPTPSIFIVAFYYIFMILILISKHKITIRIIKIKSDTNKILRATIVAFLILILIISLINNFFNRDLRIYFIDVGQGDASLIITPKNKVILIDGGGSNNKDYDVGKNTVVPYLLDRGINSIDYVIVSHFDNDHVRRTFNSYGKLKSR